MTTIVRRPSPFGEFLSLRSAMDRRFEEGLVRPRPWAGFDGGPGLPLDVTPDLTATPDEIRVEASLLRPAVEPEPANAGA